MTTSPPDLDFNTPALRRYRKGRALKDKLASWGIAFGGVSIIGAVLLIFFYLLYEVAPMFVAADIEQVNQYQIPGATNSPTLMLSMEEQAEVALRVQENNTLTFFSVSNGEVLQTHKLPIDGDITAFDVSTFGGRLMAITGKEGGALLVKHNYRVTYPNDVRLITPWIEYPYGEEAINLFDDGHAITNITLRDGEEELMMAAIDANNQLTVKRYLKEEDFISEEVVLVEESISLPNIAGIINQVEIDQAMNFMFVLSDQRLLHVINLNEETLEETVTLDNLGAITTMTFLLGENSLLIGNDQGTVTQRFMARTLEGEWRLRNVRSFEMGHGDIKAIATEQRRKGFYTAGEDGHIAVYHSTAHRTLLNEKLVDGEILGLSISPRAKDLLVETNGTITHFKLDNEHPEISWASMWDEVWYEGYHEPDFIWQSSASTNDFEPKYSLVPLAFGTLKGAFYAMLLAAPLAIAGAIYTAYFMAPALRRKVKPIIELMEALPTVILGFLAGLALAPFIENNLLGIFAVMIVMPIAMLMFGFTWANLPEKVRHLLPEGWDVIPLIPVIIIAAWFAIEISP
ncbi:MAG: phosphate transport system permease protein, partial [Bermanella sp.]